MQEDTIASGCRFALGLTQCHQQFCCRAYLSIVVGIGEDIGIVVVRLEVGRHGALARNGIDEGGLLTDDLTSGIGPVLEEIALCRLSRQLHLSTNGIAASAGTALYTTGILG